MEKEETKLRHLKVLIRAALKNTPYNKYDAQKFYICFRQLFPNTVCPMRTIKMEERRFLWTTFPNLNRWFDRTKEFLIQLGFAEDKPQRVSEIFEGVMAPPCPIDGKHDMVLDFHFGHVANTCLLLRWFFNTDNLMSELLY